MTENDEKLIREVLKELDNALFEGKIDQETYEELKQRYSEKLQNFVSEADSSSHQPYINLKIAGSHTYTQDTIKLSGASTLTEPNVPQKNIRISGAGKIVGNLECNDLISSGSFSSTGNMVINGDIKASGSLKTFGNIKVQGKAKFTSATSIKSNCDINGELTTSGSFKVWGELNVNSKMNTSGNVIVSGKTRIEKDLKCSGSFKARGKMVVEGGLEAPCFLKVGGNLNVGKTAKITGKIHTGGNLTGENIVIQDSSTIIARRFFRTKQDSLVSGNLRAANLVDIENVIVKGNVSGNVIRIGTDTTINGNVQYVDETIIDPSATIKGNVKQISKPKKIPLVTMDKVNYNVQKYVEPQFTTQMFETQGLEETVSYPADEAKFCPQCGEEIWEKSKFCTFCGAKMDFDR